MAVHQVCIIGAGSSGIAAAKILHERGLSFDCFEIGSDIGGNWRYANDKFWGKSMHSHDYETSVGIEDQNILVVGIGNSGCDIACETSRIAKQIFLSTRRGAHVIPKSLLGRPADTYGSRFVSHLPLWFQRVFYNSLLFLARGSQSSYGFPTPKHQLLCEHPTISSDLLNLVGHDKVKMKPDVREFVSDRVRFADDTEEHIDILIYATGYKVSFPFFDPSFINFKNNEVPLYKHVVHPEHPNLYFVGLLQPLGAIMPLAELQSKWVADLLEGKAGLPSRDTMRRDILKESEAMRKRYVNSKRHTMQLDYYPYVAQVKKEMKMGRFRTLQQI